MLHADADGSSHILESRVYEPARRGAVSRHTQPEHIAAVFLQLPSQRQQTVWAVGIAVQQKHAERRVVAGQFEGPVPVARPDCGIGFASGIVAIEIGAFGLSDFVINFALQLSEQPVLQREVFLYRGYRRGLGEFLVEIGVMPHAEFRLAVEHEDGSDNRRHDRSQHRKYDRE